MEEGQLAKRAENGGGSTSKENRRMEEGQLAKRAENGGGSTSKESREWRRVN